MEFLTSTLSTLVAAALCAIFNDAAPLVAERIVLRATEGLHPDIKDACEEEWLADVERRPSAIAKLRAAITLYFGARSLPQFDPEEEAFAAEEAVSIGTSGAIKIFVQRACETHEYEIETDPVYAVAMLRRHGHDDAARLLEAALQNQPNATEKADSRSRDDHDAFGFAVSPDDDGLAYPVFCTLMVSPVFSSLTDDYESLRRDHEWQFLGDFDRPFEPGPKTIIVRGGEFEVDGRTFTMGDFLSGAKDQ